MLVGRVNEPCSVRFIRWKSGKKSALSGMFEPGVAVMPPMTGFTATLLLPGPLPTD